MVGVPEEILYNRMKTVRLGSDERGEIVWHPVYLDFSRYGPITPRFVPAVSSADQGKVEPGVKYPRRNFLCGRQFPQNSSYTHAMYVAGLICTNSCKNVHVSVFLTTRSGGERHERALHDDMRCPSPYHRGCGWIPRTREHVIFRCSRQWMSESRLHVGRMLFLNAKHKGAPNDRTGRK